MTLTLRARTAWTLAVTTAFVGFFAVNVSLVLLLAEVHIAGTLLILIGAIYLTGVFALIWLILKFLGVAE